VEILPTQSEKLILNEMFAGFIKFLNTSLYRMTHINYGINSDAVNTLSHPQNYQHSLLYSLVEACKRKIVFVFSFYRYFIGY